MNITPTKKYRRVVQLELNEISAPVVRSLCARGELPNFGRILREWGCLETSSEEDYHLIEPWIQWVTAHTGKTFAEHQIFHLGNQADLEHQQIWELLATHGITSAIVGSMNAKRGNVSDGIFIPDPWAKVDETFPRALSPLWKLFSRKVQQHATQPLQLGDVLAGGLCCLKLGLPFRIYRDIIVSLVEGKLNPRKKWRLAGVFDALLAEIFLAVSRKGPAQYYTLFLNSVAHFQHHYWRNFDRKDFSSSIESPDCDSTDDPVLAGYRNFDRIVGRVIKRFESPDTLFIIVSGLSQEPYLAHEAEGGMNYYRLKDHAGFARRIGLEQGRVLPLMSRDWRIEFDCESDVATAERHLKELTILGQPLFAVTRDSGTALFIETAFTAGAPQGSPVCASGGREVSLFHDLFVNIAVKSGHHTGIGALWISDKNAAKGISRIPLAELFGFTASAMGVEADASLETARALSGGR